MPSIQQLESGYRGSKGNDFIPSIEAFKRRMQHILLNNKYIAMFGGSTFWDKYGANVQFMISAITIPQWMIDPEQFYIGGAMVSVPNGFQQGNLDVTLYNTGPELQIMQNWLKMTYDQEKRCYGYFDDLKCDLRVMQFTTSGELCQTFWFTDCTIYQIGGIAFSYDPASGPQTFSVALNYFGFQLETTNFSYAGAVQASTGALSSSAAKTAADAARKAANK